MISASTRFLAQPRLIIPTFVRRSSGRVASGPTLAADTAAATEELSSLIAAAGLFNGDVVVVVFQGFPVFLDLHGISVKDPHRDMLTAKLHRAIGRRDPAFEGRFQLLIVHYDFDIRFLERPNGYSIRPRRFRR